MHPRRETCGPFLTAGATSIRRPVAGPDPSLRAIVARATFLRERLLRPERATSDDP